MCSCLGLLKDGFGTLVFGVPDIYTKPHVIMQAGAVQMAGKVDSLLCPPHNADLALMPFIT